MISVLFSCPSRYPVSSRRIKDAVVSFLSKKMTSDTEVSVTIIGDRRMKELNSAYRQKEYATDVLSFPQNDPSQPMAPFVDVPDGVIRLGDVVVSYPTAVREATEEQKTVEEKIIELVEHGLTHLLGIHHPE